MADKFELKAILSAVDKMSPALKGIAQTAKSTRKYLLDVGSSAGKLSTSIGLPFAALSAATAGLSLEGMRETVIGFTEYAEEVKTASLVTGMTTDEIQRMKYVAKQANVSFESLTGGVSKLNKNLAAASTGQAPELTSLLRHLGIATRDANGHLRGGAEMLPALAKAFKLNTNPIIQARMGLATFGKEWQEMLPLLMEGSEGITKSYARFNQLKGIISKEDIDAAKEFGDQLSDVGMVTKGFGFTIAKQLIPVLSPLVEDFIQWAAANKKVIASQVKQFVQDLVAGLKSFDWKGFIESVKSMAHGFGTLVDMVGGARNALILFALVMNANAIMATAGMIGAIGRLAFAFGAAAVQTYVFGNAALLNMIRTALMAATILGPVGAIGALFGWFGGVAAGAGGLISGAFGLASAAVRGLGAALMANPLGIILAIATAAYLIYKNWDTLKKWFTGFFDWIGEKLGSLLGWITDLVKSVGSLVGLGSGTSLPTASPQGSSSSWAPMIAGNQRVGGAIDINFVNAPGNMRVQQTTSKGPLDLNTNVGYRGYATGMPY